jgi:RNA 2',3'-cyclic 3'-phosphodiesterase
MRLFIATHFPEAVLRDLNDHVAKLKPRLPAASWVRPETQHLTFAFLGEQPEALVDELAPDLERALSTTPKFDASLNSCGIFPNARHARVGWIGLSPDDKFGEVARVVRNVVTSAGVELDRADFKPHLTLMRMRDSWPPASLELFQRSLRDYRSQPFVVDTVTLFSSELNPKGAVHTPLKRFALR